MPNLTGLLAIMLHFEPTSCQLFNARRAETLLLRNHTHQPKRLIYDTNLLCYFPDTRSNRIVLETELSEVASKQVQFEVRLTGPIRKRGRPGTLLKPFVRNQKIVYSIDSPVVMPLIDELYMRLGKDEKLKHLTDTAPCLNPQMSIGYHNEEMVERALNKLEENLEKRYKDGLGTLVADGFTLATFLHPGKALQPPDAAPWKFFPFGQRPA
jgi:hypothetical protein